MLLREYDVDSDAPRHLPSPGACIYCSAVGVPLTDEHVVPYAIGRDAIILDKSCCQVCQKIIQPYEQEVLKKQLGVFRAMVDAPTRRKRDRPTSVTLPFVEITAPGVMARDLGTRTIPLNEAPLILALWSSPPPRILGEAIDPAQADGKPWYFVEQKVADPILEEVAGESGCAAAGIALSPVNRLHYLRSLAKTAHAYVAAELGVSSFEPYLIDIILDRSDDMAEFVGDLSGVANLEGATAHSFKITLGEVPISVGLGQGLIAVFIQFWGDLGTPPHLIIVGRALIDLESYFKRAKAA